MWRYAKDCFDHLYRVVAGWLRAARLNRLVVLVTGLAALFGVGLVCIVPVVRIPCRSGVEIIVWRSPVFHSLREGLTVVALLLAAACAWFGVRSRRRSGLVFFALSLLPVAGSIALQADRLPPWITAHVRMLFPLVAIVAVLMHWLQLRTDARTKSPLSERTVLVLILLVSWAAYFWVGCRLTDVVGEHIGQDECAYLIQAESLYADHDLDIKNNWAEKGADVSTYRGGLHIAWRSRNDHWYSWHGFGLPLLLAPVIGLGVAGRYAVLALLGAVANMGIYALGRRVGTTRRSALLVLLCFGTSLYWAVYSARLFAEMIGAALLVWLFWAIAAQDRRWCSVLVAAFVASYLPFAQMRFLPLSLLGTAGFMCFALCAPYPLPVRVRRLAVHLVLCAIGYGLFVASQFALYEGGRVSPEAERTLFGFPAGMWAVFADPQGLATVLPAVVWLVPALAIWPLRAESTRDRMLALWACLTFVLCLLTSCSNTYCVGPGGVPGRYLVAAMPLCAVGAASCFDRANRVAQGWFVFLSAVSALLLMLVLVLLPELDNAYVQPLQGLSNTFPALHGLYPALAAYLPVAAPTGERIVSALFIGGTSVLTAVMMLQPKNRWLVSVISVVGIVACGLVVQGTADTRSYAPNYVAAYFDRIERSEIEVLTDVDQPADLFSVTRIGLRDVQEDGEAMVVTTEDRGSAVNRLLILQPRLGVNDWAGRGYRWATLTTPFSPSAGVHAVRVEGRMNGTSKLWFVIRDGNETQFEDEIPVNDGRLTATVVFPWKGKGRVLYPLVRLEGAPGTFTLERLWWTPFSEALQENTHLVLPAPVLDVR